MGKPNPYPSSRSAGTRSKPEAHVVRLTERENVQLHKVVERLGGTIQSFLHNAVVTAIGNVNGGAPQNEIAPAVATGYGLRTKLASLPPAPYSAPEPEPPPPPPTPQIVINAGSSTSEVDRLAEYVARGGAPGERDKRLDTAVDILKTSAKSDTEKAQLARALDEKLATIEPPKPRSSIDFIVDFFR